MTDDAAVRDAIATLRAAGVDSPEYDARALAKHAQATGTDFADLVGKRAQRTPLQHLVGSTGFRYLDLEVGPGVFVPRPETEVLVDAVLAAIKDMTRPLVVDLCAGAGTIGFAVAHERPTAVVHLVERDPRAFEWLQRNAPRDDTDSRVHLHLADAAAALPELDGTVDVVASNPPYVAEHERELVDPEVRDHDPEAALFAGDDGLDVIRVVAATAARLLKPRGLVAIEHSDRQGDAVPQLLKETDHWDEIADHEDLTRRPRFATARRAEAAT
ncbi:MAG: release factor glutamine methyltransferase [Frankiaceae bacterium]|jgi:release factor glutamine methyltransferase|nr:release factor glutamine methyltransferase [Frankiaceae bacterium]